MSDSVLSQDEHSHESIPRSVLRLIRPQQWVKNVLVFVPLLLAHQTGDTTKVKDTLLAFVAFNLVASLGYIVNDLKDAGADRLHPRKRFRPLASGRLSVGAAVVTAVVLAATVAGLCFLLPRSVSEWLGAYLATTFAYSLYFKKKLIADMLVLAGLYTLRLLVGSAAARVDLSHWLLGLSMFLFLSLAVLKRYSELQLQRDAMEASNKSSSLAGRAYGLQDLNILRVIGPTSGYVAVMVMALYVSSEKVLALYPSPHWLWLICPVLLYWITRMWLLAERGAIPDDPVAFAARDRVSYICVLLMLCIGIIASR
ncbi:MAG: UbiA family prenyltransferase [Phycisphaeraceae bacterium]